MNDTFYFRDYAFDTPNKTLTLTYGYDQHTFSEIYRFDFEFANYDHGVLDRALQQLFFVAGVSYYKLYLPPSIQIEVGQIDKPTSRFLSTTYQNGLGELFYIHKLDPRTSIVFPVNSAELSTKANSPSTNGTLVGIGGGKDSLVSVEILRGQIDKLATWSVNHRPQLEPLIERIGLPHYWVERTIDEQLLALNGKAGTYNGHIPISAIFATLGTVVAILAGFKDVIVSNEQSANEPTLHYEGIAINHQYSKSQAFEHSYQSLLADSFADSIRYYSFLRPLSELRIAEIFATAGFNKYYDVFCSCNRAFTHDSRRMFWDGNCSKCAFVFLALTPFVDRRRLESLFHGKNLLNDTGLQATYRQLLGIQGDKPLDCVGEVKESRAAMRLAQTIYPELQYNFDIPLGYDYRTVFTHNMPEEAFAILRAYLDKLT